MADNLTTQATTLSSIPNSTKISTDEDATNGHVQRVKLAISADGQSTHIPADATDGLLVNLGANNDVTVTSGTVDLGATDNAVLDAIAASVAAIDSGQLADGHNVTIDNAAGAAAVNIQDGGNSITVDGTVTANAGSGTFTVDGSGVTQPVSDAGGSLTVDNAALSVTGGGTEAGALRVTVASDSTGVVSVDDNGSTLSVDDGGGSLTVDGTVTANAGAGPWPVTDNGGSLTVDNGGTFAVQAASSGNVAHDAADSGNPVKVGGKAYNFDGTVPGTAVAENDRANFITDVYGRQFVETTHPNYWNVSADYGAAQTNTSVKAAPGAGLKLYITDVMISNGATAGNITLLDGSGGTVKLEIYPAANGGVSMNLRTPIALSANTALVITSTTVTTHSVFVSGYTAP